MEDKNAYLIKLPYWKHLTDEEKTLIENHFTIQEYEKGSIVHGCGNECLGQILMIEGEIRTYIISEEGREITLFRLHSNDTCVLSASCVISQITFDTQMVAEKDSKILVVHSGVFAKLAAQNIYVRCYMYELLTARFSSVMWTMQQILFMGYDRRLAAFLTAEYDRTGMREIRMTHEQIAQHTSSAREVVARMLKRFAADGLIEFKRGSVTLKDIDALKKIN